MNNLPENFYLVSLFLFFQGFLILLVVFLFIDKFFSTKKQRVIDELAKAEAFKKAQETLDSARVEAQIIVKKATEKARQIMTETQSALSTSGADLDQGIKEILNNKQKELDKVISTFTSDVKSDLSQEKTIALSGLDSILDDMKATAKQQVDAYKEVLTTKTLDTESELKAQTEKYLAEIKTKMEKYEKENVQMIKEISLGVIKEITQEAIGHSMTIVDHEDTVLRLIEHSELKNLSER